MIAISFDIWVTLLVLGVVIQALWKYQCNFLRNIVASCILKYGCVRPKAGNPLHDLIKGIPDCHNHNHRPRRTPKQLYQNCCHEFASPLDNNQWGWNKKRAYGALRANKGFFLQFVFKTKHKTQHSTLSIFSGSFFWFQPFCQWPLMQVKGVIDIVSLGLLIKSLQYLFEIGFLRLGSGWGGLV